MISVDEVEAPGTSQEVKVVEVPDDQRAWQTMITLYAISQHQNLEKYMLELVSFNPLLIVCA